MIIAKRHTPEEIEKELREFIRKYHPVSVIELCAYCVGYYGAIDSEVFEVIRSLRFEGVIK